MASIKVRRYKNSVYVIYSHGNKKFKLYTGAKVDDKYWINNALKKNCPDYDLLKSQIDSVQNQVLNASVSIRQKGIDLMPGLVRNECKLREASVLETTESQSTWVKYRTFLDQLVCRDSTQRRIRITYNVMTYYLGDLDKEDILNAYELLEHSINKLFDKSHSPGCTDRSGVFLLTFQESLPGAIIATPHTF